MFFIPVLNTIQFVFWGGWGGGGGGQVIPQTALSVDLVGLRYVYVV